MGLGFLMLVLWMFNYFLIVSPNAEGDALIVLKTSLSDPNNVLESWNGNLGNPCKWFNVTCNANNSVTGIYIGNANLSGELVAQLGSLSNLQYLDLYSNNISGKIPPELGNLTNLTRLNLHQNKLSGSIPDELGKLSKLRILRLDENTLSGTIPMSLTTVASLEVLDLSFNNLSGVCPTNGSFYLFTPMSFNDNPYLISPVMVSIPPPPPPPPPVSVTVEDGKLNIAAIVGYIVAGVAVFFVIFTTALVWRRKRKGRDHFFDVSAEDDPEFQLGALYWFTPTTLYRFSLSELQIATDNFDPKNIIGRGGFGEVYRGFLTDGSVVAVKRLKYVQNKVEELQFQTEVEMISLVLHRNLLRLLGFCMTHTEKLLVYPYMANGSVSSCLRACQGSQPLLDWPKRKQIAIDSARGIAYLHQYEPKIIHRDVKAANILLDEEFRAVVGDFGLAKLMDFKVSHVDTIVCGTIGHIAPEYLTERKCSEKTDVFGYGIMLLELTSGHKATDLAQLAIDDGYMLHQWVKGLVKDKKLERLVDGNLQGNYIEEEMEQLIKVALLCTQSAPMQRPTMLEVVRMLQGDGLTKRWEQLQRQEVFYQDKNHTLYPNGTWIVDSTSQLRPDEVSGPR